MLKRAGHEVVEAPDGIEGIRLYREKQPQLVITDIVMPKKEGLETILDLRREDPQVKIIAISGGGRIGPESYLDIAEGFGANRILTKPFNNKELLEAIHDLLGKGE
jgi:YesN/AraC family two-component response regulator